MEKAKRARKAETPKQTSLRLRLCAPYFYPDRAYSAPAQWAHCLVGHAIRQYRRCGSFLRSRSDAPRSSSIRMLFSGAKMYRSGPFHKGKPEQGYQLALTPREYFAAGIVAANAWSRKNFGGKDFDRLAPSDRVGALKAMEEGKAQFQNFDARLLRPAARAHHGRLLCRSNIWRQSRQGRLEDAGFSGTARHLRRQDRCLSRQALCRGAAIDRGLLVKRVRRWRHPPRTDAGKFDRHNQLPQRAG